MPPLSSKGKGKAKENRQSRSRNTTPSSVVSVPVSVSVSVMSSTTAYLDISIGHLAIPNNLLYDDLLERHGSSGGIPDPKHLETLENDLKTLAQLADQREKVCDGGMRELSNRRKERIEEERELEQAKQDAEEKLTLKRAAEDDELERSSKASKMKKRKERSAVREERPLTHGAHGVARQDGVVPTPKDPSNIPPRARRSGASPGHSNVNVTTASGSSSSLSPASLLQSPTTARPEAIESDPATPTPTVSSDDSHQPAPAASIPQYQVFGVDPLHFDDPTIYHVREVTDDMTDEEKKEIYGVASFPHDDLRNLIAGVPPDKDFSNAKPSNQVNANTFATYLEPYLRPLTEEDMAWLRERGDRVTPFLMPARGKKHYTEIWAEEDGNVSMDSPPHGKDKLPANQPRGSLDQLDDDNLETDQVSTGPLMSRLLSLMRPENRPSPTEDKEKSNGVSNGDMDFAMGGLANGDANGDHAADGGADSRLPPATFFPESTLSSWKVPTAKLDYAQADERLKAELRYLGLIGQDEEPAYDDHYDDEVAQRLRILQAELKRVSILNGARKARLLQIAQETMAYQEYSTILEDLDTQVQQAYLKRNRTIGKGKKTKRPGGAGGGSHYVTGGSSSAGTAKLGIGDAAKTLMERRKKWIDTVTPVFDDDVTKVRTAGDDIFTEAAMAPLIAAEKEKWDEEQDM